MLVETPFPDVVAPAAGAPGVQVPVPAAKLPKADGEVVLEPAGATMPEVPAPQAVEATDAAAPEATA